MRPLVLIVMLGTSLLAFSRDQETIEQLKARVETAASKDRVSLALRVAERQTDAADKLYREDKVDEARAAVKDIVTYTEKACQSATESGKKLKDAEITVRKIAHKLSDIKRTLNFEDQAPVQDAIDHLEHLRTQLLSKMFDLGKGTQ